MSTAEYFFRKLLPKIAMRYDILVALHKDVITAAEKKMEV